MAPSIHTDFLLLLIEHIDKASLSDEIYSFHFKMGLWSAEILCEINSFGIRIILFSDTLAF